MYRMAAYCRLSKDDGEQKISESIENQLKLIREYIARAEDLELADIYIDDGYSGLYFADRPGFRRMMEDIHKGKLQGVITKDISRLGREHIETGNYIERVFPSLGIRYIAILDGVDSASHSNEELAQFLTLFNDMYSRDISKKIRGALSAQKKRGQFMSGFAPYGYVKDPADKHHFLVDEEAAQVVRKIFHMYLEGYSRDNIARQLNEEGIRTPSVYKREIQGLRYFNAKETAGTEGWTYSTVNMILKNRVYTGAMVQHKSEKISYKIKKSRYIPEEQQYVVEKMHEAVVSPDIFDQVKRIMKKRARTPGIHSGVRKVGPYAGFLVCGDCGCNLQRVTRRDGYECGSYHRKGNEVCYSHFIRKEILDSVVINEIRRQIRRTLNENEKEELLRTAGRRKKVQKQSEETEQLAERLHQKLEGIMKYKRKTYENYMDGILDQEEYLFYKTEYGKEEQQIREKISRAEKEKNSFEETEENRIEQFVRYGTLEEVTREIVTELIDRIIVNGDKSIDLVFAYQSPYAD